MEISGCVFQEFTAPSSPAAEEPGRVAAGWDIGLSGGTRLFLEGFTAEVTTQGWLGAEADGKTEIPVLVPIIIGFVLLQITNKCL